MKPRKPGQVVEEFDVRKNGRNMHVVFRYPRMDDINQILSYMNSLIKESEFLRFNKKLTKKEELRWLRGCMKGIKAGKKIYIVAEINGVVSGGGNVERDSGASSHVGSLGVSLREKYTNIGIGTRFMEVLMNEAMKIGIEVVKLSHFENNARAKHVYEKLGFKHVGIVPKARKDKKGGYQGEFIMYKILV
jgi:RimJ/RimL family protein N-acetyltransferase